ncbi:MAG: hypothetical protein H6922_05045 [Pseudomonadaceae bacterium]|nr:hypothetical protein [Pseudomonadaceae bacterium]
MSQHFPYSVFRETIDGPVTLDAFPYAYSVVWQIPRRPARQSLAERRAAIRTQLNPDSHLNGASFKQQQGNTHAR